MPSKAITIRVPTDVLTAFDAKVIAAGTNRSASLVDFMRTVAGFGARTRMAQGRHVTACPHPSERRRQGPGYVLCDDCGGRVA